MDQIEANFRIFHMKNPHIYSLWSKFTWQMIRAGAGHGSAGMIAERIRWEAMITSDSDLLVKFNNNYRAHYARMWMQQHPDAAGFFRTRKLQDHSIDSVNVESRYAGI